MSWWFLSFAKGPPPDGFLGGVYIEGGHFLDVVRETWARGINPGGEVMGFDVSYAEPPPVDLRYRLLTWQECEFADGWQAMRLRPMGVPLRPADLLPDVENVNPGAPP